MDVKGQLDFKAGCLRGVFVWCSWNDRSINADNGTRKKEKMVLERYLRWKPSTLLKECKCSTKHSSFDPWTFWTTVTCTDCTFMDNVRRSRGSSSYKQGQCWWLSYYIMLQRPWISCYEQYGQEVCWKKWGDQQWHWWDGKFLFPNMYEAPLF